MLDDHDIIVSNMDEPGSKRNENPGQKARALAGQWAASAGQVMQSLTVRKYTLPDKNVASQVLMYRQLLHTKCRPGLKLSREYQGTPAQKAVLHMPWWSKGIEETGTMEIAYDPLIRRLWLHGAIFPTQDTTGDVDTFLDDEGNPPVPHEYWVSRLGFQQTDPVTDFRSGGVLSLAMMVWIVESCPAVFSRFVRPDGDASVLPFGITSINCTDMMAKFLMLAKAVDRMDALLSQKPFWRMFADPNALLACQELSMDMLADVVVEVRAIRQAEALEEHEKDAKESEKGECVTVFDFAHILSVTEKRVEHDLLGAGPGTVAELRSIHARLKTRYKQQLNKKLETIQKKDEGKLTQDTSTPQTFNNVTKKELPQQVFQQATELGSKASAFAGKMFTKLKAPGFSLQSPIQASENEAVIFEDDKKIDSVEQTQEALEEKGDSDVKDEKASIDGDWVETEIPATTDMMGQFSIGDDDEDL